MEIKVYDYQGNLRTMDYIKGKYGPFKIKPAADGYPQFKISALYERSDGQSLLNDTLDEGGHTHAPSTLIVLVKDELGVPVFSQRVAWYWPDANHDPGCGPMGGVFPEMTPNTCVSGQTSGSGDVGFGMGRGAFYWPSQGQIGPHAAWVYGTQTRSDVILGLGMVGGTNHDHFDVEFTRVEEAVPEPPGEFEEQVLERLDTIIAILKGGGDV